jgi:hypothetical protein
MARPRATRTLLVSLCIAKSAWVQMTTTDNAAGAGTETSDRQILVMLRAPPPHFRPDLDYASRYDARVPHPGWRGVQEGVALRVGRGPCLTHFMPALTAIKTST